MAGPGVAVVDLWTDGSGTTPGNPGGWAFVLLFANFRREVSGYAADATNNRMEMTALLEGLRAIKRPCIVTVHTDSEYLLKPFSEGWLETWRKSGWTRPKKNVDLWQELHEAAKPHMLTFEWVPGHKGLPLNERCDELAGMARKLGKGMDSGVIEAD